MWGGDAAFSVVVITDCDAWWEKDCYADARKGRRFHGWSGTQQGLIVDVTALGLIG